MSISIKKIHSATLAEWDNIWQNCDYSTYFHSREWAELWNVYSRNNIRPDPKLVTFADGKKALLPLSYRRSFKGFLKNYVSSPAGTFGGWISQDQLNETHADLLAKYMTKKLGNLVWRINPYDNIVVKDTLKVNKNDETHTLNLAGGFDTIYKKWTKGHRSASVKARKAGVSVRIASSVKDWNAYYKVYEDSLRRWGDKASSKYNWSLFNEMFRLNSPSIKLWLAVYKDVITSGSLCLYSKKNVVYWHGAALEEYFSLRPVNLLIYEAIKNACKEGYEWFDFNPSGGHEGVKSFKKSFGAQSLRSDVIVCENKIGKLFMKLRGIVR